MSQESCMIIIDNSSYAWNGDCLPSRFQAQLETASTIIWTKINSNPQNKIGLMTMSGNQCQVLTTPVGNTSQLYSKYNQIQIEGTNHFANALQISQLVLKHRMEKKQKERIVVMIASEILDKDESLLQIARNFKKNQINLDIINICCEKNVSILKQMNEIINASDESTFVNYQPSAVLLQNQVQSSRILSSGENNGMVIEQPDDQMDEELQMILRISLEEEQKRIQEMQEKEQQEQQQKKEQEQKQVEEQEKQKMEALLQQGQNNKETKDFLKDPQFLKEIIKDLDLDKNGDTAEEILKKLEKKE